MRKILIIFIGVALSAQQGQQQLMLSQKISASTPVPGLISAYSSNSVLTVALGTATVGCPTNDYCVNLPDAAVSGALIIATVQFSDTPSATLTMSDDTANSYTCLTPVDQATDAKKVGICYVANSAAGARKIQAHFTAAVTQVSMKASQWYNIATSSPADGNNSNTGSGGSGSNDLTAGSFTPSTNGDLIYMVVCRTQTALATSFTAGSTQNNTTWALLTPDIRDGCADQWGVQTTAAAINPQMTTTGASRYAAQAIAFKAGSGGTAPSGMYIRKMQTWSSPDSISGSSFAVQFPTVGNTLALSTSCGGVGPMTLTGVTDGTNTWTLRGVNSPPSNGSDGMASVDNAAANSSGLMTITTTGAGDCTFKQYEMVGGATAAFRTRSFNFGTQSTANGLTMLQLQPGISDGITIFVGQIGFNTVNSWSTPASAVSDAATVGGQSLSGPSQPDQNNPYGHLVTANNNSQTWKAGFADGSTAAGAWTAEASSFLSATGSTDSYEQIIQRPKNETSSSATTLAVTMSPTVVTGNMLVAVVGNGNSRTISKICTDGATCAGGNSFTQATSAACSSGTNRMDVWYLLSAPASVTTVTATYSASATNREMIVYEVKRPSGSWAFDAGNHLNTQTGSGTTNTGAAVTTTTSADFVVSGIATSGTTVDNPALTNEFQAGGIIFTNSTDAVAALITSSAASHTPVWTDNSSGASFCSATAAFK